MHDDVLPMAGASARWSTKVERETVGEGAASYHADVFCDAEFRCRIALAGEFANDADAAAALQARARDWILEYEARASAKRQQSP
ncbi:hypothetical protein QTI66_33935 [Variovorax sp. J22R133]|uniref:hypothetical protein n=1 Tax=Variovorax brevis TaxID=3053503 RepID=UPI00257897AD|nr:hypothetical protein [Variovorax sp. J22R133]MDM0117126.1 hypothetical protein [Variovorax sp. J22R133]